MKEWIGKQASKVGSVKESQPLCGSFEREMIMVLKVFFEH
jgi:hypothetical protein